MGSWGLDGEFARVAELVDAQDLKSCFPQRKYGFDSRLGHEGPSALLRGFCIRRYFYLTCGDYSTRRFFTGLAMAALRAWKATVNKEIRRVMRSAPANTHH